MTLFRQYLKNRKEELNQLIEKFNYDTDKERLNELDQLEKFIQKWKEELNSL